MAVNSSSSNDSFLHPDTPVACYFTRPGSLVMAVFFITSILLLLPLCILVIYLGLQRRRQPRSTSAAAAAAVTSHSDVFTYHMVSIQLTGVVACTLCCCGIYMDGNAHLFKAGLCLYSLNWSGETFFHILICVDRYLAVVHPVTYLSLRGERGIRLRNISIGCVWLLGFGTISLMALDVFRVFDFFLLFVSLIIVPFCSLSVLLVLIRPGPGEQGGQRGRVDPLKRRAFYTIVIILGMLLLRCVEGTVWGVLDALDKNVGCSVSLIVMWFNLPSSLVLPLLFLHRAGTLSCKTDTK